MRFISALLVALVARSSLRAQTTLANLAGNYATSGTLTDSYGTGTWTYEASTTANPADGSVTALTYGSVGNAGNPGYGDSGNGYNVPGVSNARLFGDGATPAANQLAWHPGGASPTFTVIQWTAGAGESGLIDITGAFSRVGEPGGHPDFSIYVNGVLAYSETYISSGTTDSFDLSTYSIAPGETVDFVLGPGANGYAGDESLISASIMSAVPEPATYALILGGCTFGLAGWRESKRRRGETLS